MNNFNDSTQFAVPSFVKHFILCNRFIKLSFNIIWPWTKIHIYFDKVLFWFRLIAHNRKGHSDKIFLNFLLCTILLFCQAPASCLGQQTLYICLCLYMEICSPHYGPWTPLILSRGTQCLCLFLASIYRSEWKWNIRLFTSWEIWYPLNIR